MRWQDRPESDNVEDRRSDGSSGFNLPSSSNQRVRMGGIPLRGKTGLSVIIIVLIAGYYSIDLTPLITGGEVHVGCTQNDGRSLDADL